MREVGDYTTNMALPILIFWIFSVSFCESLIYDVCAYDEHTQVTI